MKMLSNRLIIRLRPELLSAIGANRQFNSTNLRKLLSVSILNSSPRHHSLIYQPGNPRKQQNSVLNHVNFANQRLLTNATQVLLIEDKTSKEADTSKYL